MLALADDVRARGTGLRDLNLGGGDADTSAPVGSMLFTVMAALAQTEHEIRREHATDSIAKRRAAGEDLGGRPRTITDSQIRRCPRPRDIQSYPLPTNQRPHRLMPPTPYPIDSCS